MTAVNASHEITDNTFKIFNFPLGNVWPGVITSCHAVGPAWTVPFSSRLKKYILLVWGKSHRWVPLAGDETGQFAACIGRANCLRNTALSHKEIEMSAHLRIIPTILLLPLLVAIYTGQASTFEQNEFQWVPLGKSQDTQLRTKLSAGSNSLVI